MVARHLVRIRIAPFQSTLIPNSRYEEDINSIPILYATQMHKMAQFLIYTMNRNRGEYDEFVKRKQQQRQEWRKKMIKTRLDKPTQK